jgi:hypothetical protein
MKLLFLNISTHMCSWPCGMKISGVGTGGGMPRQRHAHMRVDDMHRHQMDLHVPELLRDALDCRDFSFPRVQGPTPSGGECTGQAFAGHY